MTIAELSRVFDSKKRRMKAEAQEKAYYDYVLADLIGRSISRLYSKSAKLPSIDEAYPNLFEAEKEDITVKQDEISAMRFKQFADAFNKKFKKEVSKEDGYRKT